MKKFPTSWTRRSCSHALVVLGKNSSHYAKKCYPVQLRMLTVRSAREVLRRNLLCVVNANSAVQGLGCDSQRLLNHWKMADKVMATTTQTCIAHAHARFRCIKEHRGWLRTLLNPLLVLSLYLPKTSQRYLLASIQYVRQQKLMNMLVILQVRKVLVIKETAFNWLTCLESWPVSWVRALGEGSSRHIKVTWTYIMNKMWQKNMWPPAILEVWFRIPWISIQTQSKGKEGRRAEEKAATTQHFHGNCHETLTTATCWCPNGVSVK